MTVQQKELIRILRTDGIGYREIAERLGVSVNTVKSYGRRCVEVKEQAVLPEGMRRCTGCEVVFEQPAKRKPKRFCSDKCRLAWWHRNRALSRTAIEVVCPGCGQKFRGTPRQKHCGHPCYIVTRFGGARHEQLAN